jgi:hypothetical protein
MGFDDGEKERVYIRIPEQLKRRLEVSAKGSGRSLNSEIIARLGEAYVGQDGDPVMLESEGCQSGSLREPKDRSRISLRVSALERAVASLQEKAGH